MNKGRCKQSLRVWLRLLSCSTLLEQTLRAKFLEAFEVTLPQFDILAELDRAGKPQTMTELSRQLMVSNGNVTGVVDRLVRSSLVRRAPSPTDRRVVYIELTAEGCALFERMAQAHEAWVAELLGSLSEEELGSLTELLDSTKRSIRTRMEKGNL